MLNSSQDYDSKSAGVRMIKGLAAKLKRRIPVGEIPELLRFKKKLIYRFISEGLRWVIRFMGNKKGLSPKRSINQRSLQCS